MLIDRAKIHVSAGDGGNGCTSFYRDRAVRKGKPNGGDGGDGGSVIMKADKNIHTLLDFKYNKHFTAGRGGHGSSNHKRGKNGDPILIRVPPGTMIRDTATGLVLRDLAHAGEEVVIAVGGKGGKGNSRRRPSTPGEKGEERDLELELKLIADVGIIGYPNVGKSTLICRISKAKSKIADYPFTTKTPILGIVTVDDMDLAFADMPGLIEGAHKGRGLGDEFLRHIERTKILLHVVDIAEVEGRDAFRDFLSINKEISLYGRKLKQKPQVVACNKIDVPEAEEKYVSFSEKVDMETFAISAITGKGIGKLLRKIGDIAGSF